MEKKYEIRKRKLEIKVRDLIIEFEEKVKIDMFSNETIYDRELEIENTENLYKIYREKKGMNSIEDIINIRKKYGLTQSEFSLVLGLGKITIHRYEKGMLQTEANDMIIRLSKNPRNMIEMIKTNGDKISEQSLYTLKNKINEIIKIEKHKKLKCEDLKELKELKESDDLVTIPVRDVAKKIIFMGKQKGIKITPLKLQKLIYYVKGIALAICEKQVFKEDIINWSYGPVVKEIYHEYKCCGESVITNIKDIKTSKGLEKLIDKILETYGKCEAFQLVELTHEESPWLSTTKNEIIKDEKIYEYFKGIYCN